MGGVTPVVDDTEPERVLPRSSCFNLLHLGHHAGPLTPRLLLSRVLVVFFQGPVGWGRDGGVDLGQVHLISLGLGSLLYVLKGWETSEYLARPVLHSFTFLELL